MNRPRARVRSDSGCLTSAARRSLTVGRRQQSRSDGGDIDRVSTRLSHPEPTATDLFGDFSQSVVMLPSNRASSLGMIMTTFVAIDFETANHRRDSACAVGLATGCNGRIVASRTYTIRPPTPQFSFTGIHGVRWEDVRDALRSVTSGQRYAGGSTTWNSWPPTTRRSIGVSSSRVARDTGCVRREHRSLVPSSLLAHNGEFTRRRCQTSADSFVFCSITTTPGRTRKRARASYSPPRPQATREDGHPRRDGRRLWRLASPVGARRTNSAAYQ